MADRITQVEVEVVAAAQPSIRISQVEAEIINVPDNHVRVSQVLIEVLIGAPKPQHFRPVWME